MAEEKHQIQWGDNLVSAIFNQPQDSKFLLILAHGAGAGMEHSFFEELVAQLSELQIATLRFQFPYMEAGKRRVDSQDKSMRAIEAASKYGQSLAPKLPLFIGGKSFGGRMASHAVSEQHVSPKGLIFYGFPLHPAGKEGTKRAEHLKDVSCPMLFLQGTRDRLCRLDLLEEVTNPLALTETHLVNDGDHSFKVRKKSGEDQGQVIPNLARKTLLFIEKFS